MPKRRLRDPDFERRRHALALMTDDLPSAAKSAPTRPMNHCLLRELVMTYGDLPDFVGVEIGSVATKSNFGNYPLNIAASRGDRNIVLALLEAGADINAPGDEGYTPLHDAAEQGRDEIVKILLCRGADRTALNRMGDKPADTARFCGNPNVAEMIDDYAG